MCFLGSGPLILVQFWIEKDAFKMAAQNFGNLKKSFSIQHKCHSLFFNFSKFQLCSTKIKKNIADSNSGL